MGNLLAIAGVMLCLSGGAFSAQAPYIETFTPLEGRLFLGVDRTASSSRQDVAFGLSASPSVKLSWPGFRQAQGLFAGGKLALSVASYQMWLLAHPEAAGRKDIPSHSTNLTGKFEVRFFNAGQLIGTHTLTADQPLRKIEESYCRGCNDHLNPAYRELGTAPVDIPLAATDVKVVFLKAIDLVSGVEAAPMAFERTVSVFYHANPDPIHIRGRENMKPYDLTSAQFWIMEDSKLKIGSAVQIEAENFINTRRIALIFGDTPIRHAYENTPICYDKLNPNRAHFSNGNDIEVEKKRLHYRVDKGAWQQVEASSQQTFEIPPVQGSRLEIAFEYQLVNNLDKGLHDINRCYQIGSSFEWVPVQPGVKTIHLGTFYDSPRGDLNEGWEIQLEP